MERPTTTYELRFAALRGDGLRISVPCNERGDVNLDELSDQARQAYLFAHLLVGLEFASPTVWRAGDAADGMPPE